MPKAQIEAQMIQSSYGELEFEEGTESKSFPYLQMTSLPNLSSSELQTLNPQYGWTLFDPQAEAAGFVPSSAWERIVVKRDGVDENNKPIVVEDGGWITRNPRFLVVFQCDAVIETRDPDAPYPGNAWKYAGPAFLDYKPTELKKQQELLENKESMCMNTKLLVLFLDEENNPLHETPIMFNCRYGWGGNTGIELTNWRKAVRLKAIQIRNEEIRQMPEAGRPNELRENAKLSPAMFSYFTCQFKLGWHRAEPKHSPSVTVVGINVPTNNPIMIGKTKVEERKRKNGAGYEVTLTGESVATSTVLRDSRAGQLIAEFHERYSDFTDPNRGVAKEEITAVGKLTGSPEYAGPGINKMKFETTNGTYGILVPATASHLIGLDEVMLVVGTHSEGVITAKTIQIQGAPEEPRAQVTEEQLAEIPF